MKICSWSSYFSSNNQNQLTLPCVISSDRGFEWIYMKLSSEKLIILPLTCQLFCPSCIFCNFRLPGTAEKKKNILMVHSYHVFDIFLLLLSCLRSTYFEIQLRSFQGSHEETQSQIVFSFLQLAPPSCLYVAGHVRSISSDSEWLLVVHSAAIWIWLDTERLWCHHDCLLSVRWWTLNLTLTETLQPDVTFCLFWAFILEVIRTFTWVKVAVIQ